VDQRDAFGVAEQLAELTRDVVDEARGREIAIDMRDFRERTTPARQIDDFVTLVGKTPGGSKTDTGARAGNQQQVHGRLQRHEAH
jgi:hypothetical protein